MNLLIKKATVICKGSAFHNTTRDILIKNGIIETIGNNISEENHLVVEAEGLHVSIGWVDTWSHFSDPGNEQRETLTSGSAAAAAGGFTDVFLLPNTVPATSTKSQVEYLKNKSKAGGVNIHPIATISLNAEGKQLAEMYDMSASGAVAFSDGLMPILDPGMLFKALQYVLPIEGTIIQLPYDDRFVPHALMNEGIASTRFGLPGTPAMAEALLIHRDIQLAAYSKSKIHFTGVSTMAGMQHIEEAKNRGEQVSCSVSPFHLWYVDEDLASYDSNYKLVPPLRTTEDRAYLQKAFTEGKIDCIASHHLPQLQDEKDCELAYAKPGMISLQTAYGMYNASGVSAERLVDMFTTSPREIFGLPMPAIAEGEEACFTLFCPAEKYTFTEADNESISKNTTMYGTELTGRVIGIINNKQFISTQND